MALHVMEKYFTSRVNTMKKTFKEDAALLKRMRRTGGAPNSGYGLDASKESFIRDLEEKEERKRRQDEVCVHDHVNHLLVVYIHPPSHTQERKMNEKKACLLKAQRVVDDKAQSEEIMLRVNRVMRTEGREVLESDVSNEELKTLMRHFDIPQKVAKLKAERFKVSRK